MYTFTQPWFDLSELKKHVHTFLQPLLDKQQPIRLLEIGSYEGMSACHFSDKYLLHPQSELICVDPFDLGDVCTPLTSQTKTLCLANIAASSHASQVQMKQMYSSDFFKEYQGPMFDFIYIDGSHLEEDIKLDMTEADKILEQGGIMWMDDYLGGHDGKNKRAMDSVISTFGSRYSVVHQGYQIALRKVS